MILGRLRRPILSVYARRFQFPTSRPARQADNDGFVRPESHRHARPDRASSDAAGKRLPVGAGNDVEGRPAMTVSSRPNLIVTPDVIGRLLMPAGKRLPVGAGNDKKGAGNDVEVGAGNDVEVGAGNDVEVYGGDGASFSEDCYLCFRKARGKRQHRKR